MRFPGRLRESKEGDKTRNIWPFFFIVTHIMNMDKISWTYTQYVELIPENQLINTRYVYYAIFTLVFQYIFFFNQDHLITIKNYIFG